MRKMVRGENRKGFLDDDDDGLVRGKSTDFPQKIIRRYIAFVVVCVLPCMLCIYVYIKNY